MNKRLAILVCVVSLGGFVFGYDLGALSAASASLRTFFRLSPWAFGLTISSSLWGTVCGSVLAGRLAEKINRLNLLALCSILYMLAAACIASHASSKWLFVIAMRVLCGIAVGGFTVGCPLYLSEIAPARLRGRVVGLFQLQVGAGVIAAFFAGAVSAHFTASSVAWKWVLGLGALPAMSVFVMLRITPGIEPRDDRDGRPMATGCSSVVRPHPVQGALFRRKNTRLILLSTSIALFNQLSGVNILLLYMLEILASAGVGFSVGHTYTVLISCLSMGTTLAGMAFVDRLGRKPLLYIGAAGMAVCLLVLAIAIPHHWSSWIYLFILIGYNAFFAFSQGTVVWVYLSELFPPGLRERGQGYGTSVHWVVNALLVSAFPWLQHSSSVRVFYVFAGMMALQIAVVWLWYPETRGTVLGSFGPARKGDFGIVSE